MDSTFVIRRPIAIFSRASRDVSTGAEECDVVQAGLPGGKLVSHGGDWSTKNNLADNLWLYFNIKLD